MKKIVIIAVIAALLGAAGLWVLGLPAYRHWKERRFMERAKEFMAKGDYRNASLSVRQTLALNQRNVDAWRIQAELAELSRSPQVLDCRRRIAELAPTVENKLMLATAAIMVQGSPFTLAAQTLSELRDSANDVANYHAVAAELALKLDQPAQAAAEFEAASRLDPTNQIHQINLAVLHLHHTNATVASEARATLDRLRANSPLGTELLRWLVADSLSKNDLPTAQRFCDQLLADPKATLDDRLLHLTILQEASKPELAASLGALQSSAGTNALQIYAISHWMTLHGKADDALRWLANVPGKIQAHHLVRLALVESYMARKDWAGLEAFLDQTAARRGAARRDRPGATNPVADDGKWGDLEFMRLAYLSHAAAEQKQELAAEARWRAAVREAGDQLGPLTFLLGRAGAWGQAEAREDLLWIIAQRFPRERWALLELERLYQTAHNTRGLNRLYTLKSSYDPKDFQAKNNLAATSMLLKFNLPAAHQLAKEVYLQHPQEAIVASTYAYSLHLQGRTKEGLGVLEKLQPEALETPAVALYYGVLLAAAGETTKAQKFFALAKDPGLLPEEKTLLARAGQ